MEIIKTNSTNFYFFICQHGNLLWIHINQNSMVFLNIRFNLATDMTMTSYS